MTAQEQPQDRALYVPHPVERRIVTVTSEGREISSEQRERVVAWLKANGIEPADVVPGDIRVETSVYGDRERSFIAFTQYVNDANGTRIFDWREKGALTVERLVEQDAELPADPAWEGWEAYRQRMAEQRRDT